MKHYRRWALCLSLLFLSSSGGFANAVAPQNKPVLPAGSGLVCDVTVPEDTPAGVPILFKAGIPADSTDAKTPRGSSAAKAVRAAYDWDFGDGTPHSKLQNPSHSYSNVGWYLWSVRLTVGARSCTKSWILGVLSAKSTNLAEVTRSAVQEFLSGLKKDYQKEDLGLNLVGSRKHPIRVKFEEWAGGGPRCRTRDAEFIFGDGNVLDQGVVSTSLDALKSVPVSRLSLRIKSGHFVCRGPLKYGRGTVQFIDASVEDTGSLKFSSGAQCIFDGGRYQYDGSQWRLMAPDSGLVGAMGKAGDPALLAELAKKHGNALVRLASISSLNSEPLLVDVALNARAADERRAALDKVTSQPLLLQIVNKTGDAEERLAAARRITDQRILQDLARSAADEGVRIAAVNRVTDSSVILGILNDSASPPLRSAAMDRLEVPVVEQIGDQKLLADIAANASNPALRIAAVKKVGDQQLVRQVARTDSDADVRLAAVQQIQDLQALPALVESETSDRVALAAVERISDPALLIKIAAGTSRSPVRRSALNRIADEQMLAQFAAGTTDADLGVAAVERVKTPALLENIARQAVKASVWSSAAKAVHLAPVSPRGLYSRSATSLIVPFTGSPELSSPRSSFVNAGQRVQDILKRNLAAAGWTFAPDDQAKGIDRSRRDLALEAGRKANAQAVLLGNVTAYSRKTAQKGTTVGFDLAVVDVLTGTEIFSESLVNSANGNPTAEKHAENVIKPFVKRMNSTLKKQASLKPTKKK